MTLLLTEADVRSLLTMPIALEIVEESLRQQGNGELVLHPRRRIKLPDGALLHYMAAGDTARGYIGMKIYTVARGAARFVVPLFRSATVMCLCCRLRAIQKDLARYRDQCHDM